jgi:hypothetical protein
MNNALTILVFMLVLDGVMFMFVPEEHRLLGADASYGSFGTTEGNVTTGIFYGAAQNVTPNKGVVSGNTVTFFNVVSTVWDMIKAVFNFITMPLALLGSGGLGLPNSLLIIIGIPITVIYIVSLIRLVFSGG